MTMHYLTRQPSKTFHDDPGFFEAAETLRMGYHCYGVGGWDETTEGRTVHMGPLERGPHAFAYGHATVIAANPLPETRTFVDVEFLDEVRLDGVVYRLEPAPNQNVKLVPVPREELLGRTSHRKARELAWQAERLANEVARCREAGRHLRATRHTLEECCWEDVELVES